MIGSLMRKLRPLLWKNCTFIILANHLVSNGMCFASAWMPKYKKERKKSYLHPCLVKDYTFRCICCSTDTIFSNKRTTFWRLDNTYLYVQKHEQGKCRSKLLQIFIRKPQDKNKVKNRRKIFPRKVMKKHGKYDRNMS